MCLRGKRYGSIESSSVGSRVTISPVPFKSINNAGKSEKEMNTLLLPRKNSSKLHQSLQDQYYDVYNIDLVKVSDESIPFFIIIKLFAYDNCNYSNRIKKCRIDTRCMSSILTQFLPKKCMIHHLLTKNHSTMLIVVLLI